MTSLQFNSDGLVLNVDVNEGGLFGMGTQVPHVVIPLSFEAVRTEGKPEFEYEVLSVHCDVTCKCNQRDEIIGSVLPCLLGQLAQNLTSQQMLLPLDHPRLAFLES